MTHLSDGTIVTDIDDRANNDHLTTAGYTIRHVETYLRDEGLQSFIRWDPPEITDADIPF